jgi:hypothetical protein
VADGGSRIKEEPDMAVIAPLDQAKVDAFAQKVFGHITGFTVTAMVAIGDQLGLFKDLV